MSEPLTVYDVLEEMRRLADDARPVFFNSSKVGIEKTELSKLIKRIEQVLPDDIRKAKTVLETRDDILEKSREEAEKAVSTAQADAQRMVNSAAATAENTLTRANQQATEQLEDAKTRSNDMLVDAANRANAAIAEAQQRSSAMIADAEERAKQMVADSTIMENAHAQAQQLIESTQQRLNEYSQQMHMNMMGILESAEGNLMAQVEQMRALRSNMNAQRG